MSRSRQIYLDNQATTVVDPRVAQVVMDCLLRDYGNPSSNDHSFGDDAERVVDAARAEVAALLSAPPKTVAFTSGATESLNIALQGFVRRRRGGAGGRPVAVGLTPLEHSAVIETCEVLSKNGEVSLRYFRVDGRGQVDLNDIEGACQAGLDLVCVMAANNEIGTIYPLCCVAEIARRHGARLLVDATQAVGRIQVDVNGWGIDLVALSAHKLHGPKGVGALLVASNDLIEPLSFGGGQEAGIRPGTLNVPGIAGLGEACRLRRIEMEKDEPRIARLRDKLEAQLVAAFPDLAVNGDVASRLACNLHVAFPRIPSTAILARLRGRVAASSGSACSSGTVGPSHVVRAIGLAPELLDGCLRISLSRFTSEEEIGIAGHAIISAAQAVYSEAGSAVA